MVLSLAVICLVCSALLGLVYSVTAAPIADAQAAKVRDAIGAVVPQFDNSPADEAQEIDGALVYTAKSGGNPVGYAVKVSVSGFGGALQMMVGFTPDGTVYNTSIISHSETPGLGAKITLPEIQPRAQVVGKNPATTKISVRKDGGDIDAITASTITSRAFLNGVNVAYAVFQKVQPAVEATNTETDEQE